MYIIKDHCTIACVGGGISRRLVLLLVAEP